MHHEFTIIMILKVCHVKGILSRLCLHISLSNVFLPENRYNWCVYTSIWGNQLHSPHIPLVFNIFIRSYVAIIILSLEHPESVYWWLSMIRVIPLRTLDDIQALSQINCNGILPILQPWNYIWTYKSDYMYAICMYFAF